MSKADYVRNAPNPGGHTCHWPGCTRQVKPAVWGCQKHWYTLPATLRDKVWRAFRPGQEVSKTPSAEYIAVAREVEAWISAYEAERKSRRPL